MVVHKRPGTQAAAQAAGTQAAGATVGALEAEFLTPAVSQAAGASGGGMSKLDSIRYRWQ